MRGFLTNSQPAKVNSDVLGGENLVQIKINHVRNVSKTNCEFGRSFLHKTTDCFSSHKPSFAMTFVLSTLRGGTTSNLFN
ncbi:hypothetical protein ACFOG5_22915 [Pedobacter fastidiosus]|uniref:hypothetical protein n=1 Tax=Pedobacter fastidiosus TaxID=2765361 RepID=UPI00360F1F6C